MRGNMKGDSSKSKVVVVHVSTWFWFENEVGLVISLYKENGDIWTSMKILVKSME